MNIQPGPLKVMPCGLKSDNEKWHLGACLTCVEVVRDRYKAALEEIRKGAGPYSRDPLEHATNTIEAMKALAAEALDEPQ
jgi:hypothetical protein